MEELTKNLKELINKSMISLINGNRAPTPDETLKMSDAVAQYERITRLNKNDGNVNG